MHEVIANGLEDYLSGHPSGNFEAHLNACQSCRHEVLQFSEVSRLIAVFREPVPQEEQVQPNANFYARLARTLDARKAASLWAVFSINASFGRRLAFASLMTLALLGGFLVSRESDYGSTPAVSDAEAIMASHDTAAPHEAGAERERMMAALTSYEE